LAIAGCWLSPGVGYRRVLAIAGNRRQPITVRTTAQLAADLLRRPARSLRTAPIPCGPRRYAWAWVEPHPRTTAAAQRHPAEHELQPQGSWSLLVRRNLTTSELAFYRCYAPSPTTMAQLITVAGRR